MIGGTCSRVVLTTVLVGAVYVMIAEGAYYHHKQQPPYNGVIKDAYVESRLAKAAQLPRAIDECMFVTSESGPFKYVAASDDEKVCGVYLLTDPDKRVEIHVVNLDAPCETFSLISVVDGWELNGELFPSERDHALSLEQRANEFCGNKGPRIFQSSQNVALIQYRIPKAGRGFTIYVVYPRNPMPCNVLAMSSGEPFTLRNYGNRVNCTYTALYQSIVEISLMAVGPFNPFPRFPQDDISHKCLERSPQDQLIIGGSHGLDTSKLEIIDSICGASFKSGYKEMVDFGVTSVRLVSSGLFNNFVSLKLKPVPDETMGVDF